MRNKPNANNWLNNVQSLFYPHRCLLCGAAGAEGRDLCPACLAELPHNPVACRLCALPFAEYEGGICGTCLKRPPPLDGSIIPFRYASPLDHLLLGLKFSRQLLHARLLGGLLADAIVADGGELPDVILPMPLHPARLRERGYNQALELGRPVTKRLGLPLLTGEVLQQKATAAQSRLEKVERRRNIKGGLCGNGHAAPVHRHHR